MSNVIELHGAERIFAHCIVCNGKEYPMSVAWIDERCEIRVEKLQRETPSTVFVNGKVEVSVSKAGKLHAVKGS